MNRFLTTFVFGIVFLFSASAAVFAVQMTDFTVRESEREGETLELVALDASGNSRENFSGALPFSVNGFETDMKFKSGRAFFPREVAASTFLYVKYVGEEGHITRLFYVYRGMAGGFNVLHIPLVMLVIIPLALVLIGMFFRRLIILMLLLLGAFFYFNSSKGFSLSSFFDAVKEWITGLLQMVIGI